MAAPIEERWDGTCDRGLIGKITYTPGREAPYFALVEDSRVSMFEDLCGTYKTLRGAKCAITYQTSAKWTWVKTDSVTT